MLGKRNHQIDLWRFVFSLIIVIHHSRNLVGDDQSEFLGGSLAVEFFFLVSGYLMISSIEKQKGWTDSIALDTAHFIKKKWCSFYPEVLLAWGISFVFTMIAQRADIQTVASLFASGFQEGFLLYATGLVATSTNAATWYLSSMLLCMAILYPLIRKYPKAMKYYVMPLCALLLWGWMRAEDRTTRNPTYWMGLTYKGNIRALCELQLGAVLYYINQKFKNVYFTKFGKLILTVIEWGCYIAAILYMYFRVASRKDILFITLLCIAVMITFSGKAFYVQGKTLGMVFTVLGKFSFPLYLCHSFYAARLNNILPAAFTNNQRMAVYLVCAFVTALVVWGISALLRKNSSRILQAGKRLFLEKTALNT